MGLWDGLRDAKVFERGEWFDPGFDGIVEIKKVQAKPTRNKGDILFIECVVVELFDCPSHADGRPKHPVGWRGSWSVKLQDKDIAFSNILSFVAAVSGYTKSQTVEIDRDVKPEVEQIMQNATDYPENNLLTGQRLHLRTVGIKTKAGTNFTVHNWDPVS